MLSPDLPLFAASSSCAVPTAPHPHLCRPRGAEPKGVHIRQNQNLFVLLLSPPPRLVREFVAQNNTSQIKHVIQILSQEFALSQHPHSRKGGLIGLAACSIALGKVRASVFWLLHITEGQKLLHVPR